MKRVFAWILALVTVLALTACGGGGNAVGDGSAVKIVPDVIFAKLNSDGTAYITLPDGNCIVIQDKVKDAAITADRSHVIVLLDDGTLYVTDKEQTEKTEVDTKVDQIRFVRDTGFFYAKEGDNATQLYRKLFAEEGSLKIDDKWANAYVAQDTLTLLYKTDDALYVLKEEAVEAERIGAAEGDVSLNYISNDGTIAVCTMGSGSSWQIMLFENGEKAKLGTVENKYGKTGTVVRCAQDQKLLAISHFYAEEMWIKKPGAEVVKAKLGGEYNLGFFTSEGYLDFVNSAATHLYVTVDGDSGESLYAVSMEGEREKLISNVDSYDIAGGYLAYVTEDEDLMLAKLDGGALQEEKRIAGDVNSYYLTDNGKYLYYLRNVESDTNLGDLYCLKVGTEEAKKIGSDATLSGRRTNTSGDTIFYFKNVEKIKSSYTYMGDLMSWSYGKEENVKVSSEVIQGSATSYAKNGNLIDLSGLVYSKYNAYSDEAVIVDAYFYNGTESTKQASEIKY